MKVQVIKFWTLLVFALLINGNMLPANAAPSNPSSDINYAKKQELSFNNLSANKKTIVFVSTLSLISLAVLLGTGKSIKREKSS